MYESSNELLKLTQDSSVHTQTHARIRVQYTPRVEQSWAVVPQRQKGHPGWAVQARHTQARLAKERGVCSACRPAQRSLRVQTAQRGLGVQTALAGRGFVDQVAINTNAPEADGCDRHSGREKQCPGYTAGEMGVGANGQFEMLAVRTATWGRVHRRRLYAGTMASGQRGSLQAPAPRRR